MMKLKSFIVNNQRIIINSKNDNFIRNNNLNNYKFNDCKKSSLNFYNNKSTNGIFNIHKKKEFKKIDLNTFVNSIIRRNYHDEGIFGYQELLNRVENANLLRLVTNYRTYGHKNGDIDPLEVAALDHRRYGLNDPNRFYNLNDSKDSKKQEKLEEIINYLKKVYCGRVTYEFMHIPDASEKRWFYNVIESNYEVNLKFEQKKRIFELLVRSEVFDHFMAKKFPQVKRYGLEGGESMMVALDKLFEVSNKVELVMCMPHRGRLNLLTDLLKFSPIRLFHKIKGNPEFPENLPATGDVLSHLGKLNYCDDKLLSVSMLNNPSHLEAVNPVAMGKARAKQMDLLRFESDCELGDKVMCIQLHGDAAFTGQGIVTESFGLSNLPHFSSGGSIHIVVNNQLGYTTPAQNARSSWYCSDIGKIINAPVIHVNGDYPEDVTRAVEVAFEYHLITYRRWGHNELDEPAFTQPLMYSIIRSRKSNEGQKNLTEKENLEFRNNYFNYLDEQLKLSDDYKPEADALEKKWSGMVFPKESIIKLDTGISREILEKVGRISVSFPDEIVIHPRLLKFHIQSRLLKLSEGKKIDWATAESLAFGTLLLDGYNVRICGQDVGRGTFSQRHAMFVCQKTERVHIPLNNLDKNQGMLEVANSNLSELAVVGFEYGMSSESPNNLIIWEAQFGDFFNGAQIIIDTYISSGEAKWLRQSGLVMLLPHGYDGAGPEHSSARIERFLQLTNDRFDVLNDNSPINTNMHIVNPSTPAQYFHVLRRQIAVSNIEDMLPGTTFNPVLCDIDVKDYTKVEKLVFISGKIYYELLKERENRNLNDSIAFIRIEELCPFPKYDLEPVINKYQNVKDYIWCQEESQNNGAYTFIEPRLSQLLPIGHKLKYVGRPPTSAPAVVF
ncbi:8320_t:CDS:10 [Entrophospora sp. SA101]|nr:8320_t:CDS:10 [Entrophospora sp. SA101]